MKDMWKKCLTFFEHVVVCVFLRFMTLVTILQIVLCASSQDSEHTIYNEQQRTTFCAILYAYIINFRNYKKWNLIL